MTRSIPHHLRRCSCGRGVFRSGPRMHFRTAAGRRGAMLADPTSPGSWHRTRSFAATLSEGAVLAIAVSTSLDIAGFVPSLPGCSRSVE